MNKSDHVNTATKDPIHMRRIPGAILCRRQDEYGEIIVAQEDNTRALYFGAGINQSAIRIDRPDLLVEDYHEAMMSALIFNSEPETVFLIGLGGCSLVHFLLKALPRCVLDVAELRQEVIDVSRKFFLLPAENANLRIVHAAGEDFVRHRASDSINYDLILVDAFDESGPAASLLEKTFLSSCRMLLKENGVFAINVWNGPGWNFPGWYASLQAAFENHALKLLLSESYRNAVAFGFKGPGPSGNPLAYRRSAADLRKKHGINFPGFLRNLYWQNFNAQAQ